MALFFSPSSLLSASYMDTGEGGDSPTLLGRQAGLSLATLSIFHQSSIGSHSPITRRNTVWRLLSPHVPLLFLRPGGRVHHVLPFFPQRPCHRERHQCRQRPVRKTRECLLRSYRYAIPRHVSFEFGDLVTIYYLTCAGWNGDGKYQWQDTARVGDKDASCSIEAFDLVPQQCIAPCSKQERAYS